MLPLYSLTPHESHPCRNFWQGERTRGSRIYPSTLIMITDPELHGKMNGQTLAYVLY